MPHDPRRHARHDRHGRNVLRDNCARSHNRPPPDRDAGQDDGPSAEPDVVLDHYELTNFTLLTNRPLDVVVDVIFGHDGHVGPEQAVLTYEDTPLSQYDVVGSD